MKQFNDEEIAVILVGNKSDLSDKRQVSFEEASVLAGKYSIDYIEVSAKTGLNIEFMFEILCKQMVKIAENSSIAKKTKRQSRMSKNETILKEINKSSSKTRSCCS